jgi:hypothetical protein
MGSEMSTMITMTAPMVPALSRKTGQRVTMDGLAATSVRRSASKTSP